MLNLLLEILINYGWMAVLILIVLFGIFKLILFFAENKIKQLFFTKHEIEHDLKFHQFFADAQYKIVVEIPSIDLFNNKPVRQQVFRDLLIIYFKILYDKAKFIVNTDMAAWSPERWTQEISYNARQMIVEFNDSTRREGIPEAVIIKFSKWHSATLELLYDYITSLGTSSIYVDNKMRTNTLLLIMNLLMVTTIADAERSLQELNGEISGEKYKGKKIEE